MKRLLLVVFCFLVFTSSQAQLAMTNGQAATALTSVIVGGGVTITNVTYTGDPTSKGEFSCAGNCNLGLSSGIMLSSGVAGGTPSPASNFHSNAMGTNGDATLNSLLTNQVTYDAAVLEFDFSVASDSVKFEYVFGSEEYNDYVNTSFNDIFGFFISGPGITGVKNLALIPGTTTPVSINNVNNGGPYGGVSSGPCNNCQYFVDNVNGTSVYLDAFTTVLRAKSAVQPCETYHIKLAIADVSDQVFNSDVFIGANSFSSLGQIQLFANGQAVSDNDTVYGCAGQTVTLALNSAQNYNWSTGQSTQTITVPVSPTPTVYSAYVFNPTNFCFAFTTQITVMEAPAIATITPNGSLSLCPGGSVTLTANSGNAYQWSNGATVQSININSAGTFTVTVSNGPNCTAVSNPVSVTVGNASANITGPSALCNGAAANLSANIGTAYIWSTGETSQVISATSTGIYTVTVTQSGGCTASATTNLSVNANPVPVISGVNIICQGSATSFDAGAGYSQYNWSNGAATQTMTPLFTGNYTVTVTDANGCSGTATYSLTINSNPTPAISGITAICQGAAASLDAGVGYNIYQWSNGANSQVINPTLSGLYTVTVTNASNCTASISQFVNVNALPTPAISGISSVCQGAAANLDAGLGYANYAWSSGAISQVINPTVGGVYSVTVTDVNGCTGSTSINVAVNANPTPMVTGVNVICQGTPTSFDAGMGYSLYTWSNGANSQTISPNISGPYTVTVTDGNGCTGTSSLDLTVNALPTPVIVGTTSICSGAASLFDAGVGYSNYAWSNGGNTQTVNLTTTGNYVVTVTDVNGCAGSANLFLTVNALPTPAISGVVSVCQGAAANLDAGLGFSNYSWSTGAISQIINPTIGGVYSVTVTDANGCTGSTSINVAVNTNPTPTVTGVNVICQGTPTSFDAGMGYSLYIWSNGANSQSINPYITGIYTVTVTDANGCTGTSSLDLTVNALPTPLITGTTSICQGTASTFDAGAGYTNYAWSNGANSQTVSLNTTGTYFVTVTDLNGCTASTNLFLNVNALPTPSITGILSICQGANATLDAGLGYSIYQWSSGNNSQVINPNSNGIYTVTVTDANGCTGSVSATVVVNNNPVPSVTGVNIICQGTPTTFDAGAGYVNYQWSNGGNTQTISPNTTGNYSVIVTDGNGCTGSANLSLTVNINPTPVISGTNSICQGAATTFDAGAGYSNYQWSNGGNTQNININTSGNYVVTVTDGNGCTGSTSYFLTVNALPVPIINGTAAICDGSVSVLDAGNGYTSYQWNNGNNVQSYNATQTGIYSVVVTDINGCTGSASFSLTVNANPIPAITGINTICDGLSSTLNGGTYVTYQWSNGAISPTINATTAGNYIVTVTDANGCTGVSAAFQFTVLTATASITANGPLDFCRGGNVTLSANAGQTYQWSNGASTQNITFNDNGVFTVIVVNNNGCTATSTPITVAVHEYPVIKFVYDSSEICKALRITFVDNSITDGGSTYLWSFGDGKSSNIKNPIHDYKVVGDYIVSLTITSPWGCQSKDSLKIHVDFAPAAIPKFSATPDLQNVFSSTIIFTDESQNAYSWHWEFGDNHSSDDQNPIHQYDYAGTFTVTLIVKNKNKCEEVYTKEITIAPFWIPNAFTPNGDGKNDVFFNGGYHLDVSSYKMSILNRWGQTIYKCDSYFKPWDGTEKDGKLSPVGTYVYIIDVVTNSGRKYTFRGTFDLIR